MCRGRMVARRRQQFKIHETGAPLLQRLQPITDTSWTSVLNLVRSYSIDYHICYEVNPYALVPKNLVEHGSPTFRALVG